MTQTDISTLAKENAFDLIGKEWMLVTAGDKSKFNTMTASWGGIGWLWNKHVAFVFIRPERYTHAFIEASNRLTLSFFGMGHRDELMLCGRKSGRDTDKVAATGLNPLELASGTMTFAEARLVLDCRKLFKVPMKADAFVDKSVLAQWYNANPGGGLHDLYIVEIESVYTC